MNRREIFLDFTSLLDVTLIVIFFFVIFSSLNDQEYQARADEAIQQAESREAKAEALEEKLENEISIVAESNERRAEDVKELINFSRGDNIKLIMKMDEESWQVQIVKDGEAFTTVPVEGYFETEFRKAFDDTGYDSHSTVLCQLIYDGNKPGSALAYRKVARVLDEIKNEYESMYISETDLSIGGE